MVNKRTSVKMFFMKKLFLILGAGYWALCLLFSFVFLALPLCIS